MFFGQMSLIISLAINLWIARYLGPQGFGVLSYVIAFAGLFSFVANLGLNDVLVRFLVEHPQDKDRALGTGARLLFFGGLCAFALAAVCGFVFEPKMAWFIVLYATIFIFSPFNVISAYFQSVVEAKKNALAQIIGTVIVSCVKVYCIVSGAGIIWFVGSFTLDYLVGAMLYIINYERSKLGWRFLSHWDGRIARELSRGSILLMLSAAASYIYLKLDQVMVKSYLDETAVGIYAVAVKLSEIWYFIPGIVCASLFPAIINAKNTNREVYLARLKKLYVLLGGSAFLVALPIVIFASHIITLLYGAQYIQSVPVLQIYVWSGIGFFLSTGITRYFMAEDRFGTILAYNIVSVLMNVALNMILLPTIGLTGAAWATLVSYSIMPIGASLTHIMRLYKKHV